MSDPGAAEYPGGPAEPPARWHGTVLNGAIDTLGPSGAGSMVPLTRWRTGDPGADGPGPADAMRTVIRPGRRTPANPDESGSEGGRPGAHAGGRSGCLAAGSARSFP